MNRELLDLKGVVFGHLEVMGYSHMYRKKTYWSCKCSCGNTLVVSYNDLLGEITNTCESCKTKRRSKVIKGLKGINYESRDKLYRVAIGFNSRVYHLGTYKSYNDASRARANGERLVEVLRKELSPKPTTIKLPKHNLVGRVFGELTVVSFNGFKKGYASWVCKCSCGNTVNILEGNLLSGRTLSCGCYRAKIQKDIYKKHLHIYDGVQIEKARAKVTPKNNTSGFRGVMLQKNGKYRTRLIFKGTRYELGYFDTLDEAIEARLEAEKMVDAFLDSYDSKTKK